MNIVILKFIGVIGPAVGYALLMYKFLGKLNKRSCKWLLGGALSAAIIYGMQIFLFASMFEAPFHTAWLVCGLLISIAAAATLLHFFFRNKF